VRSVVAPIVDASFAPMKSLLGLYLPSMFMSLALAACSAESAPAEPCHDLAHDGSTQSVALASNSPPEATGGAISEGSYVLTAARLFDVPLNVDLTRRLGASLDVHGGVIKQVTQVDGMLERSTFKYTVSNTMLSLVDTCGGTGSKSHGFSATPTQLEILSEEPGTAYTLHRIFSKR